MAVRFPIISISTLLAIFYFLASATAIAQKKHPPAHPIDLNTATIEQFEQLPGIGPTTAKAIVRFREKSGPFRRVEDLLAIRGITKKRLEKLRSYIIVEPAPSSSELRLPHA